MTTAEKVQKWIEARIEERTNVLADLEAKARQDGRHFHKVTLREDPQFGEGLCNPPTGWVWTLCIDGSAFRRLGKTTKVSLLEAEAIRLSVAIAVNSLDQEPKPHQESCRMTILGDCYWLKCPLGYVREHALRWRECPLDTE